MNRVTKILLTGLVVYESVIFFILQNNHTCFHYHGYHDYKIDCLCDMVFGGYSFWCNGKVNSYFVLMGIPIVIFILYLLWHKQTIGSVTQTKSDTKTTQKLSSTEKKISSEQIPYETREDYYTNIFNEKLDFEGLISKVGAAALLNISEPAPESSGTFKVSISERSLIKKYFGDLQFVQKLVNNKNFLRCKVATARAWMERYLKPDVKVADNAQIWLVWNTKGDIIGFLCCWRQDAKNNKMSCEYHPSLGRRDLIENIKIDKIEPEDTFFVEVNLDNHPYRFEQKIKGGIIYLKELVNSRWVNTGFYDPELKVMQQTKGKATILTPGLLMYKHIQENTKKVINNRLEKDNF